jgi:hypothetical protein
LSMGGRGSSVSWLDVGQAGLVSQQRASELLVEAGGPAHGVAGAWGSTPYVELGPTCGGWLVVVSRVVSALGCRYVCCWCHGSPGRGEFPGFQREFKGCPLIDADFWCSRGDRGALIRLVGRFLGDHMVNLAE